MSRKSRQRPASPRRRPTTERRPTDIWRDAEPLPDVEPVTRANDPTALIRSLGQPPLADGEAVLLQYAAVIERSADVAAALALLADDEHSSPS